VKRSICHITHKVSQSLSLCREVVSVWIIAKWKRGSVRSCKYVYILHFPGFVRMSSVLLLSRELTDFSLAFRESSLILFFDELVSVGLRQHKSV